MESPIIPLRILLADDDEGDRFVFQEIFEDMEMKTDTIVYLVNDGYQLMDFLKKEKKSAPSYYLPGSQYAKYEWPGMSEEDQKG